MKNRLWGWYSEHELPEDVYTAFDISNRELSVRLRSAGHPADSIAPSVGKYLRNFAALDASNMPNNMEMNGRLYEGGMAAASLLALIGEPTRADTIENYLKERFNIA